jgi:prepilin peptidase CpaA
VLCAGGGTASAVDLSSRRIPNALSFAMAATGLGLAAYGVTGITVGASLLGCVLGLIMMLPGHVLGATGAGDVKLFAASGTILGGGRVLEAFFFVAIAGGIFALATAWQRGRLAQTMISTGRLCGRPRETKAAIESPVEHNRFPYGPAIAVGCVLAVLV